MPTTTADPRSLRCPSCDRLLARVYPDGRHEIRARGRRVAVVVDGTIACPRCKAEVEVGAGGGGKGGGLQLNPPVFRGGGQG